jgi:hypothetical protein
MRFGHLGVRCGPYRILIPGENIAAIDEGADHGFAAVSIHEARRQGWPLVMDTRVLLGLEPARSDAATIDIQWHSNDGQRQAVLRVDAVDGLRHDDDDGVLKLPRVPSLVRDVFDGLVRDGADGFLLQLRQDVRPPLDTMCHRCRFVRAVLGARVVGKRNLQRLEPLCLPLTP